MYRVKRLFRWVRARDSPDWLLEVFLKPLSSERVRPHLSKDVRTLGIGMTVIGLAGLITTFSVGDTSGALLTLCCGVIIWLTGLWLSSLD